MNWKRAPRGHYYSARNRALRAFERDDLAPWVEQRDEQGSFLWLTEAESERRMRAWLDRAEALYGLGRTWQRRRKINRRPILFLRGPW